MSLVDGAIHSKWPGLVGHNFADDCCGGVTLNTKHDNAADAGLKGVLIMVDETPKFGRT